jgi:glycosyltransferase involved in cell wall biosynthesis
MTSISPTQTRDGLEQRRILIFIPMYNCEAQIRRVIAQFSNTIQQFFTKIIIVDNRSTDGGLKIAKEAARFLQNIDVDVLQNANNYGLGGSHKVAFDYAIENNFDYVIVLHGDDQGSIEDLLPWIQRRRHLHVDCLLGARFMTGSKLQGYSLLRTLGNRLFNLLFSLATGRRLYDLGSGLNLYAVTALADRQWMSFPDDLTFNYYMILASAAKHWRMTFFPLTWREEDQRSNVKLFRQAWKVLAILSSYVFHRSRFLSEDWREQPGRTYQAKMIATFDRCQITHPGALS